MAMPAPAPEIQESTASEWLLPAHLVIPERHRLCLHEVEGWAKANAQHCTRKLGCFG